jgi:DNA-binding ferritin-like protein (Dps family)
MLLELRTRNTFNTNIPFPDLLTLHEIGFRLIPLAEVARTPASYTRKKVSSLLTISSGVSATLWRHSIKKGKRHNICYTLSGALHNSVVPVDCATSLLQSLAKDDEELENRLENLNAAYRKNRKEVTGYYVLYTTLQNAIGDKLIAKNILSLIDTMISNKNSLGDRDICGLLERLVKQFDFKTMRNTEDVYYYDEIKER